MTARPNFFEPAAALGTEPSDHHPSVPIPSSSHGLGLLQPQPHPQDLLQTETSPKTVSNHSLPSFPQHEHPSLIPEGTTFQAPASAPSMMSEPTALAVSESAVPSTSRVKNKKPRKPRKNTGVSHARKTAPDHIPRPRNAFILFRSHAVKTGLVPEDMEKDHRNISRIVSHMWNSLGEADRGTWQQEAQREKEEHARLYPDYKYKPTSRKDGKSTQRNVNRPEEVEKTCEDVADMILKMYGESGIVRDDNGETMSRSMRYRQDRRQAFQEKLANRKPRRPAASRRRNGTEGSTVYSSSSSRSNSGSNQSPVLFFGDANDFFTFSEPHRFLQLPDAPFFEGRRRSIAGDLATSIPTRLLTTSGFSDAQAQHLPFDGTSMSTFSRRGSSVPPLEECHFAQSLPSQLPSQMSSDSSLATAPSSATNPAPLHSIPDGCPAHSHWKFASSVPSSSHWPLHPSHPFHDASTTGEGDTSRASIGGRGTRKNAPAPFHFATSHAVRSREDWGVRSPPHYWPAGTNPFDSNAIGHQYNVAISPSLERRRGQDTYTPRASMFNLPTSRPWNTQNSLNEVSLLSPLRSSFHTTRRPSAIALGWPRHSHSSAAIGSPVGSRRLSNGLCSPSSLSLYPPPTPFRQFTLFSNAGDQHRGVQAGAMSLADLQEPLPDNQTASALTLANVALLGAESANDVGSSFNLVEDAIFRFSPGFLTDMHDEADRSRIASPSASTAPALSQPPSTATNSISSPATSPLRTFSADPIASMPLIDSFRDTDVSMRLSEGPMSAIDPVTSSDVKDQGIGGAVSIAEPTLSLSTSEPALRQPLHDSSLTSSWTRQDAFGQEMSQRILQSWLDLHQHQHQQIEVPNLPHGEKFHGEEVESNPEPSAMTQHDAVDEPGSSLQKDSDLLRQAGHDTSHEHHTSMLQHTGEPAPVSYVVQLNPASVAPPGYTNDVTTPQVGDDSTMSATTFTSAPDPTTLNFNQGFYSSSPPTGGSSGRRRSRASFSRRGSGGNAGKSARKHNDVLTSSSSSSSSSPVKSAADKLTRSGSRRRLSSSQQHPRSPSSPTGAMQRGGDIVQDTVMLTKGPRVQMARSSFSSS